MKEKNISYWSVSLSENKGFWGTLLLGCLIFSGLLISGCTKDQYQTSDSDPLAAFGIENITPANFEDSVVLDPEVIVTFADETEASEIESVEVTLICKGTTLQGIETTSGKTATFTFDRDLMPMTDYTATVSSNPETKGMSAREVKKYSWKFRTGNHYRRKPLSVISVSPLNDATGVPRNTNLKITMDQVLTPLLKNIVSLSLKNGQTTVPGTIDYDKKEIIFTPVDSLEPGTKYTASFALGNNGMDEDNNPFTWSFTTAAKVVIVTDNTAPAVSSVSPANNATAVTLSAPLIVTFSEAMDASTITGSTISVKQGTVNVAGNVTYSQNAATFTPSAALAAGTVYTATVTTGVKDVAGNALASNYSWNFTTATAVDATAPTVSTVTPAANATGVALNSAISIIFSEPMTAATISASSITLKQGSAAVTGTVAYSSASNTATFTPTAALVAVTVYTATVTTGVKDAAGNALAADYSWNFTTVAAATAVSFSGEVVPILNKCNTCHTHGWTPSSTASTYYTNLVNANYVNPASPSTSKIYIKLNSGHPSSTVTAAEKAKVLTWMSEGSNNN